MKFSTIIMTIGLAAFAAAQSSTITSSVPVRTSSYTDEQASCLGSCKEDDVSCRAECLGNPAPDAAAVDATNACAAACPQGVCFSSFRMIAHLTNILSRAELLLIPRNTPTVSKVASARTSSPPQGLVRKLGALLALLLLPDLMRKSSSHAI